MAAAALLSGYLSLAPFLHHHAMTAWQHRFGLQIK
jgi:hypothetical protein